MSRLLLLVFALLGWSTVAIADEGFAKPGAPTLILKKKIKVGYWPKSVELTPDGKLAVVASLKERNVSLIDTTTLEVARILEPKFFGPVETIFLDNRAFISGGFLANQIFVYDLGTWELIHRVPGGRRGPDEERHTVFPKIMTASPDGSKLYVAYWVTGNVGVFDAQTYKRLGLIEVGDRPRGMAITLDNKKGYVCNFGETKKSITVFRAHKKPFKVLRTIRDLPNPRHMVMTRDGQFLYVSLWGGKGGVAKIDTETDKVVLRSEGTGIGSKTLKLSPDEKYIYMVNYGPGTVSVLEAATLEEVSRFRAGIYPQGLSVSADGKTLWTTEEELVRVWDIVIPEPQKVATSPH